MVLFVPALSEAGDDPGREVRQLAPIGILDGGQHDVSLVPGDSEQVTHQGSGGGFRPGCVRADQRDAPLDQREAIGSALGDQSGVPACLVLAIGIRVRVASRITLLTVPLMVQ